jgi:hypothetical protein
MAEVRTPDPRKFLRRLCRALDKMKVGYYVEEDKNENVVYVSVPLDEDHLPRRIYVPYASGGGRWLHLDDFEGTGSIDDYLQLLAERIAKKLGYGSVEEMPYFEPLDLTWHWKIPLSNN